MNETALLIIDAQVNMFEFQSGVYQGEQMLGRLLSLIASARAAAVPVIFIQNNGTPDDPDFPGTTG